MINRNKYCCDAALIGFPDAGKSTLFNTLTGRSDSKKMPRFDQIGSTEQKLVLADIGGLSHGTTREGINPGSRYLSYIEKARVLVFVIALTGKTYWTKQFSLSDFFVRSFEYLLKTILTYRVEFGKVERIIVLNRFSGISDMLASETQKLFCSLRPMELLLPLQATNKECSEMIISALIRKLETGGGCPQRSLENGESE